MNPELFIIMAALLAWGVGEGMFLIFVPVYLEKLGANPLMIGSIFGGFGLWYWFGVAVFLGMLVYQHSIVKPTDLRRVNIAFMTANGIASIVFAVFVLVDLFIKK